MEGFIERKANNDRNFASLVKGFIERKAKPSIAATPPKLLNPADVIANDLKKSAPRASKMSNLHRSQTKKAFLKGKENMRMLAMVLKSEHDLTNRNKEYETEIEGLKGVFVGRYLTVGTGFFVKPGYRCLAPLEFFTELKITG
ncbi:unnamed protein product [Victoria cruziana]